MGGLTLVSPTKLGAGVAVFFHLKALRFHVAVGVLAGEGMKPG
jgi:hypothetical protein